ncbi:VOC family protein [Pantoea sp. 18069]|uniref:VOC family protein n=1 Tax=Pantoea sp. 18069 TaxID=2681415 RepID=UPI0013588965|nr:VOC family protein [Pantoea sp. 18069]
MTLSLDHLVIAVSDLPRTIADYGALGFHVIEGGRHPGRPTHNALVVFEDGSYLELIAWHGQGLAEDRWWQWLQAHGEGLVDFALHPGDVRAAVERAGAGGLVLEEPLAGGRARPDGELLKWQTARAATPDLPFLCGDITPRQLRVPQGAVRRHANGASGVASVSLVVDHLETSLAGYQALLGREALQTAPLRLAGTGLRLASLRLPAHASAHGLAQGSTSLVLLEPDRDSRAAPAQDLSALLRQRGQGVLGFALRGSLAAEELPWGGATELPRALTHGALIEYQRQAGL